jgi:alpha-L-fucosidase
MPAGLQRNLGVGYPPEPMPGDTTWFTHDRFGLFIHWGLYALPARHEWVKHNEQIPDEKYDAYFKHFDPDLYDPRKWASAAAEAGMKYFVVTTKHHEGFCLWDTRLTDYKAPNTPAARDLLKPMVEAFRQQNMRVGFYHSLIDWHHPQYVLDKIYGPYRNHPDREKMNRGRDQKKYAQYLHGQVRELLTGFGPIDILWFDFSYPQGDGAGKGKADWQSEKLVKLVRKLAPKIILDDRLDLSDEWDVKTPEQIVTRQWPTHNGRPVIWEDSHRLGQQGRQSAAQRRPHWPWRIRRAGAGSPFRHRPMDAPAQPIHLRLHAGPAGFCHAAGLPIDL